MKKYTHIILGAGQATGTLIGKLAGTGDSIAVIEGKKVGGSCVNYGCTPTKTLVAAAKAIYTARQGDLYGFSTGQEVKVNFQEVYTRMNKVRVESRDGLRDMLKNTENVELIEGWGVFTSEKTLQVGDRKIEGENIYINVGTSANMPDFEGIHEVTALDSAGLLAIDELPKHLLILGGGYIGIEYAQIFRRLGSEVTIIQRDQQLMPREDEDVATAIQDFLEKEGIEVLLETNVQKAKKTARGLALTIERADVISTLSGSHFLVAIGRHPNTERLDLAAAGIKTDDKGYIQVDDHCRTNVDGVFAVGDVNGEGAFTHTSVNDAEIVLDYLLHDGNRKISDRTTIYGLFTDPPLGRIGMSEKEARESGRTIKMATHPMNKISRAKEMGQTKGFAKLLVDAETDLIVGASILGIGGDEVINMFAAIIHSRIPCRKYREVVLVHPTVSELMPFVLDGLEELR
ncbi:MAG: mercuric reductase [Bacteroidota bacterium]